MLLSASLILCVLVGSPYSPGAAEEDRETIRKAMAEWWDSIESIDMECERLYTDPQSADRVPRAIRRERTIIGTNGARSVKMHHVNKDGSRLVIANERTDGKTRYQIDEVKGKEGIIDQIIMSNNKGSGDLYGGVMSDMLWILTPGGRPLHKVLDEGAALEVSGSGEQKRYTVRFPHVVPGGEIVCQLSPDHDWLPYHVNAGGIYEIHVTKFGKDNGHDLPVEGYIDEKKRSGKQFRYSFKVASHSVNRGSDRSVFLPPTPQDGAVIMDQTKGKNTIQGGIGARTQFDAIYKQADDVGKPGPKSPLTASRDPRDWPVALMAVAASSILLLVVLVARIRRKIQAF